jgi:transcriptional antiterminator NusG
VTDEQKQPTDTPPEGFAASAAQPPYEAPLDAPVPAEALPTEPVQAAGETTEPTETPRLDVEAPPPGEDPRDDEPVDVEAVNEDAGGESMVVQSKSASSAASQKSAPKARKPRAKKADELAASAADVPKSDKMDWYILKIQSNREDSIRDGLLRRVAIAGLEYFFGDVIVPTEKVTEFKGGKKRVTKRKLYPGYLVVQMEINDDTWFLVRETPGIGDFTGAAGRPAPMLAHEVARIVSKQEEKSEKAPKLNIGFRPGDQVKINEGTFENFEGQVETIDETNGRVTVMINIFGRSTPVELEYWQIGAV